MERTKGRELKTIITFRREIKIGVAKDIDQRFAQVADGIPGRIELLYFKQIEKATTVEAELHRRFARHNFTPKGARSGSGRTEFFRLTNGQIREAKRRLNRREEFIQDLSFIIFAVVVILIYIGLRLCDGRQ